jgi:hypothetical protein
MSMTALRSATRWTWSCREQLAPCAHRRDAPPVPDAVLGAGNPDATRPSGGRRENSRRSRGQYAHSRVTAHSRITGRRVLGRQMPRRRPTSGRPREGRLSDLSPPRVAARWSSRTRKGGRAAPTPPPGPRRNERPGRLHPGVVHHPVEWGEGARISPRRVMFEPLLVSVRVPRA